MIKITLTLAAWIMIVIGGNAFWHIKDILNKHRPNYLLTNILRGIAAILFMGAVTSDLYEPKELTYFLPLIIFCATSYIVIYNPLMNYLKNKYADAFHADFFYLGKKSGFIDRFLVKHPALYRVFYFGCAILLILSTIVIYQKY